MITTKSKILTIMIVLFLGLLLAGIRGFDPSVQKPSYEIVSASDLSGMALGGVRTKMPENSAKILFESILGIKLKNYQAYGTVEETLYALRVNEIQGAWFSSVTARYLIETQEGLKLIPSKDIIDESRLSFALALRDEDTKLCDNINLAISSLKATGRLSELVKTYIDWAEEPELFYEKDMEIRQKAYSYSKTIYVGITGMTPPIDMLDEEDKPFGFAVALMDEIAKLNGINVKFVVIKNEAAFSSLMSGKIDALFCYGTSKSTFDPDNVDKKRAYLMTDGYYVMEQYSFLTLENSNP